MRRSAIGSLKKIDRRGSLATNAVIFSAFVNLSIIKSAMSSDSWILLILTLFAGAASPGPSLALVMRTAISNGRRAGVLVAVAHGIGVWLYALAVALGIASILFRVVWGMTAVQLMGVLFIAYLGISMIRGGLKTLQHGKQDSGDTANTTIRSHYLTHIRDGFFIVFFNPKIVIFFLAVFSQFLSAGQSIATQIAAATLAGALDAAWYALVAVIVSTGQIAKRIRAYAGHFDIGFGFLLCGVASILVAQGI